MDAKVQLYIRKVREGGGAISSMIVMAAARGILLKCNRGMLVDYGGHIELNRYWAQLDVTTDEFCAEKSFNCQE